MTTKTQKPALALLKSLSAIDKAIVALHTTGQSLQADMHLVACSVLAHVGKHRDTRVLAKLIEAMPDMSRKNSLILWFETFGNVKYSEKTWIIARDTIRLGDAIQKPFWKFKALEGAAYIPLDMNKWIMEQVKKLEKDTAKTGKDHSAVIHALRLANADQYVINH